MVKRGNDLMVRKKNNTNNGRFHVDFINSLQKMAYGEYLQHDIIFLLGPAGTGKTYLASAFALKDVLEKNRKKIVLTRPIVEAGEKLGYLPGTLQEKIDPYVRPVYDCMQELMSGMLREDFERFVTSYIELAPIAYMRGRTMHNSICIFDEAQNATMKQLILFLTRLGKNSKMIITGDPTQSDLYDGVIPLVELVKELESVPGIAIITFGEELIVRHPLVAAILNKLKHKMNYK